MKILVILLISWHLIGLIYGIKLTYNMLFEFSQITNEKEEYVYIEVSDLPMIMVLILCYSFMGAITALIYYSIECQNLKIKIGKRRK